MQPHAATLRLTPLLTVLGVACASHENAREAPEPSLPPAEVRQGPATYYDDIQPLFARSCTGCHQSGGIAPFPLDNYGVARAHATRVLAATEERTMPPWLATADGSCETFSGSLALGDADLERIRAWVDDGMPEGDERALADAPAASLAGAVEFVTPAFAPMAAGTGLAEADEYRCFLFDPGVKGTTFITGFEVLPGTPGIVHHVLGMLVDPYAPAASGTGTNLDQMLALRASSPERDGWPCFGLAGDGVAVDAFPVVWGPGQPVVEYPRQSGVPVTSTQKLVVQVHYNLANAPSAGVLDQTTVRLRFASEARRIGGFAIVDPFLDSLSSGAPDVLAAGQPSVAFSWRKSASELGIGQVPGLELTGVMPHMHGRARNYRLELGQDGTSDCALEIQHWDMHWQRLYFYAQPPPVAANTEFSVTCGYDTSADAKPVSPGWGIDNEMCATVLYLTAPNPELR